MNSLRNQVQLIGNLGNDPEIFTFENGNKRAKISIATNEVYRDAKGEKVTKTDWHTVIFWGKPVEIVEKYLHKGNELAISGKLTYREYEDKDGIKRYVTEIVGNELVLLSGKKE